MQLSNPIIKCSYGNGSRIILLLWDVVSVAFINNEISVSYSKLCFIITKYSSKKYNERIKVQ